MGRFISPDHVEALKLAALARLHDGEPEALPSLAQMRERVFLDLAQNGIAIYACPDHPLACQELNAVLHEVQTLGWQGAYELLPALADTYPLHVLIVCAVSLTGPGYTASQRRYSARDALLFAPSGRGGTGLESVVLRGD